MPPPPVATRTVFADDQSYGDSRADGEARSSAAKSAHSVYSAISSLPTATRTEDYIRVVVRVRPENSDELAKGFAPAVECLEGGRAVTVKSEGATSSNLPSAKPMSYDCVYEAAVSQEDFFIDCGLLNVLDSALDGYAATVFAYGQTGSGKTFTMTGPPSMATVLASSTSKSKSSVNKKSAKKSNAFTVPFDINTVSPETLGIVPRAMRYIFEVLTARSNERTYSVRAAYLEIYNEQVRDLLNPSGVSLPVRWSRERGGFYVENAFVVECEVLDDCLAVLEVGLKNRAVGSHALNEMSSRSHSILTLYLDSEDVQNSPSAGQASLNSSSSKLRANIPGSPPSETAPKTANRSSSSEKHNPTLKNGDENTEDNDHGGGQVIQHRFGKISFVDLAGSERQKKSRSVGTTVTESNHINKSLLVLGHCISMLSEAKGKTTAMHVPFRESCLTKLLMDSVGGNGYALMIACISPTQYSASETMQTLRYASRAKKIRNKPVIRGDPREELIEKLRARIRLLEIENRQLRELFPSMGSLAAGAASYSGTVGSGRKSGGGKMALARQRSVQNASQSSRYSRRATSDSRSPSGGASPPRTGTRTGPELAAIRATPSSAVREEHYKILLKTKEMEVDTLTFENKELLQSILRTENAYGVLMRENESLRAAAATAATAETIRTPKAETQKPAKAGGVGSERQPQQVPNHGQADHQAATSDYLAALRRDIVELDAQLHTGHTDKAAETPASGSGGALQQQPQSRRPREGGRQK